MKEVLDTLTWANFLPPFLSTFMASVTVLIIEHMRKAGAERKDKLYAVCYVLSLARKELFSCLMLNTRTIAPHIAAVRRAINGDVAILNTMFEKNDVDIMKVPPIAGVFLPEKYKSLLGEDDIELVTMHDALKYYQELDEHRKSLNVFVAKNLPNANYYSNLVEEDKLQALRGYLDLLQCIDHDQKRSAWFIIYVLCPRYEAYSKELQFLFYRKKNIRSSIEKMKEDLCRYPDAVPRDDYMQHTEMRGIQEDL